jgi:fluoride exporter
LGALLWVGLGGFLGAIARYLVGGWVAARAGAIFPWGTFVINVSGSFVLGFFLAFAQDRPWVHPHARLMFAVGFIGAYTTFSTYSYESIQLMMDGQFALAAFNIIGSVALGLAAVFAGIALGSAV